MNRKAFALELGHSCVAGVGFSLREWGVGICFAVSPYQQGTDWEVRAQLGPLQLWVEKA